MGLGPDDHAKSFLSGHRLYGSSIMAQARDSLERKVTPIPKLFSSFTLGKAVSGQDSDQYCLSTEVFPYVEH